MNKFLSDVRGFNDLETSGNLAQITVAADFMIHKPLGIPYQTQRLTFHVFASSSVVLTVEEGILGFAPKTLTANKLYILEMQYNGVAWVVTNTFGGY